MMQSLEEMLSEPVEAVKHRERYALESLLASRNNRVVLFGAGTLGRRAQSLLKSLGAQVLAFTDNNSSAWGTFVDEVPVLSPQEAAALYGKNSAFFVTIWNDRHWFSETLAQLSALGCDCISTYAHIFWRFPTTFLTLLLLNEPPHRLYEDAENVLSAEGLWADEESLHIYQANIAWRALGDASELPGRPRVFTYFPEEIFRATAEDSYLDCGAFDGDTVREILALHPQGPASIYAVEADAVSFEKLSGFIRDLPGEVGAKVHPLHIAIGKERCVLHFESSGSLTSKVSDAGVMVDCFTVDEVFQNRPLSIIKMDIEGAEYDAILGGRHVIQRDQPILAICVYHTQNDIWRIPLLVHDMLPKHKLYLRAYEGDGFQTVLFAVPPQRVL
jgi:FkbM family methyltransferase